MKILVTGFEAFRGERLNPSEEIIKGLQESLEDNIFTLRLPVEFKGAKEKIEEAIHTLRPDLVLSLGQAAGRECLTVERVAINVDDAKYPDNSGHQPVDEYISEDGPAAYFTTLPLRGMVKALREKGIEAGISNSAGTYVCNHVMYWALHLAETRYPDMRAGFLHVPYMKEQAEDKENAPYMELSDMVRAVETVIRYFLSQAGTAEDTAKDMKGVYLR